MRLKVSPRRLRQWAVMATVGLNLAAAILGLLSKL